MSLSETIRPLLQEQIKEIEPRINDLEQWIRKLKQNGFNVTSLEKKLFLRKHSLQQLKGLLK